MSRGLSTANDNALQDQIIRPFVLVEIGLPTALNLWSGIGSITIGATTYQGVGDLGSIEPIEEIDEVAFTSMTLNLSGVPADLISQVQDEQVEGKTVTIKLGLLDSSGALIDTPHTFFTGEIEEVVISLDPAEGVATITISSASILAILDKNKVSRYSNTQQQTDYSGDLALEFLTDIIDKQIEWRVA